MKRLVTGVKWQACKILFAVLLAAALVLTWPWWYPWLLWRHTNTSWVVPGPGVNHRTYVVTNLTEAGPQRIPKIIHQTWKDEKIPKEWQAAQKACQALHSDFEYRLWTDAKSREFIADKFPELLRTWDAYPFAIQRADAIRYAILQEFGGYYIDLDIECIRPLHFLGKYPFVMPKTWPVGFSNDFLAAEPNNTFIRSVVKSLPRWNVNLGFKYPTVMFSTGPMLITLKASLSRNRESLWVLSDDMYNKYVKGEQPLFVHYHGSSWHGNDARYVLWLLNNPIFFAILTLTGLAGILAVSWRNLQRRRSSSRKGARGSDSSTVSYAPLSEISTVKDS